MRWSSLNVYKSFSFFPSYIPKKKVLFALDAFLVDYSFINIFHLLKRYIFLTLNLKEVRKFLLTLYKNNFLILFSHKFLSFVKKLYIGLYVNDRIMKNGAL